jgi:hypothetical protein
MAFRPGRMVTMPSLLPSINTKRFLVLAQLVGDRGRQNHEKLPGLVLRNKAVFRVRFTLTRCPEAQPVLAVGRIDFPLYRY